MHLIDELRREHDLIERVLGSLRTFVARRIDGSLAAESSSAGVASSSGDTDGTDPADAAAFLRFFRLYAGHYHHAREEDTLFVALERELGLPAGRGPIAILLADHRRFAGLLDEVERLVALERLDEPTARRLQACVTQYAHGLWHHIDAENSVLLPESEARLAKAGTHELPSRAPTEEEAAARQEGLALLERYPQTSDTDAFRGDGCPACPAFGVECEGIERAWWNESEWDEFADHLPSG